MRHEHNSPGIETGAALLGREILVKGDRGPTAGPRSAVTYPRALLALHSYVWSGGTFAAGAGLARLFQS